MGSVTAVPAGEGEPPPRPANVRANLDLVHKHAYDGSYRSVLRFVRANRPRAPAPAVLPRRDAAGTWPRPTGASWPASTSAGAAALYAFVMALSHSRKEVVVWSERVDQLRLAPRPQRSVRRLGGIPAVVRIDNLKTGIAEGAGPWGRINPAYKSYARCVGFHVDACLPGCPRTRARSRARSGPSGGGCIWGRTPAVGAAGRQRRAVGPLGRAADLPATGRTVQEDWLDEQKALRPLPLLPEAFDVAVTRAAQKDCTVNFEGRASSVPFRLCGLDVEVRGCAAAVQVVHDGRVVAEHPRSSRERVVLDPAHYEGPVDKRVAPPVPLGRMGRRLQEIVTQPVESRPIDLYAALAEVAR